MLQSTAPQLIGGVAVVFLPESAELRGQPACLVIRSSKSYATLLLTFRGLRAGLSAIGIRASGPENGTLRRAWVALEAGVHGDRLRVLAGSRQWPPTLPPGRLARDPETQGPRGGGILTAVPRPTKGTTP
jgi:hypothetical protein